MIKVARNSDYMFKWTAPQPVTGTVTFNLFSGPSGNVTANMTQGRADVTITAIASDRRTLTLSSSASSLLADQQRAFIITNGDTYFSVTLSRIVGTSAILAEPLPREIDLSTSATLHVPMYYHNITSANLSSTDGYYSYSVVYKADLGSQNQELTEKGTIKVTLRPFDTGLDHASLLRTFAQLAGMIPRRQSDFTPQINSALDELSMSVRSHLSADNLTEDEVFNAESFKLAHAYCTAAMIYEQNAQLDLAEAFRARCAELMASALDSVALDIDGDGVIDDGEENLSKSGGSATDFRASWRGYTKKDNDLTFTPARGMRH